MGAVGRRRKVWVRHSQGDKANLKAKYDKIQDEEGRVHSNVEDIAATFTKHTLITEEAEEEEEKEKGSQERVRRSPCSKEVMTRVWNALSKTKNKSAAGPDGFSLRLLEMIKGTALGERC